MKLSQRSIQILRNFAAINPSLQFDQGNVLKTISPNKTVMAKATIEDNIPQTFAIYDLSRFLGVVSLFDDPEFELNEKMVAVKSPGRTVNYTYADPSTIITPPNKEISVGAADATFTLKQENLAEIMKALGVMSFPDLVVAGESGKIVLRATDSKNPSSDKYDIEVGETDSEFVAVFKTENLKILPTTYEVEISSRGVAHFNGGDTEYWISIEANSKF